MDRLQRIPTLSIIIPTLNEANHLPLLLADLKSWPRKLDLLIVDGGSTDLTVSIGEIQGIKVIESLHRNRGYQLNLGASKAKGDWLLFLHADSRLDKSWEEKIIYILKNYSSKEFAWYFNFKIRKNNFQYRLLEIAVAIRSYLFNKPYGDQGLLIHKDLYNSSKGYYPLKLMEDLEFITRLTKTNKLRGIGSDLYTDDIKWVNSNIIKHAIKNATLRRKWRQGYDIDQLSKEYYQ